ncbi:MAG: hypothetical protein Q8L37_01435 [Candidatus Gottesmanbacteria bacterium]|nr:hypothetical protein [Candidatus Gottesmanbacteria bacterium]
MNISPREIVEKGKMIYYQIKSRLEKKYNLADYVSIEVNSGKYFVGKTPIESASKAKAKFPKKQFFIAQVGRVAGVLK